MTDIDTLSPTGSKASTSGPATVDTSTGAPDEAPEPVLRSALVEIAIPVYNEEQALEQSVRRLRTYLDTSFPFSASIVIVDNASIDGTWTVASALTSELAGVSAIHLDQKGRGRAIRAAWEASRSEVVAYMDVDLSTDLDGLLPLVAPLVSNHSQVAIGSRLAPGSRVLRGGKREFISRSYNLILRSALRSHFSDAQCGFKAVRRDVVPDLLGAVKDQAWFFDTELLVQAERNRYRIHEVSVDWIDDPDTRVNIINTATEDLKGVWRLARQRVGVDGLFASRESTPFDHLHEMGRYASVGILSTLVYLGIFLILRAHLGMFGANLVAAAMTALLNTTAHVMFTFRSSGASQTRRAVIVGALSFLAGIGLTTAALAITYAFGRTSPFAEGIAILIGMLAASCVRFVLLREWAFRNHSRRLLRSAIGPTSEENNEHLEIQAA